VGPPLKPFLSEGFFVFRCLVSTIDIDSMTQNEKLKLIQTGLTDVVQD